MVENIVRYDHLLDWRNNLINSNLFIDKTPTYYNPIQTTFSTLQPKKYIGTTAVGRITYPYPLLVSAANLKL